MRLGVRSVVVLSLCSLLLRAESVGAIPKSDFVSKANAICSSANSELKGQAAEYENQVTADVDRKAKSKAGSRRRVAQPKAVESFILKFGIPRLEKELADLRSLGNPDTEAKQITAAVDAFAGALAEVKKHPREAAYADPFRSVHKLFVEVGITECGSGSISAPKAS